MGCNSSSQRIAATEEKISYIDGKENPTKLSADLSPRQAKKILNGKSSLIRLDHCPEPRKLSIKGKAYNFTLQYCYVSQRGYYPTSLGKANQDSYLVCEALLGDSSCNFFGIFDGHGEYGDLVSHYVAEHLSDVLIDELNNNGGMSCLDGPNMTDIVSKVHVLCNRGLEKSSIDESLSGTTSISIIQKGDKLIVSNVGDSRAIIATEKDGKLLFSPLSSDQTPYRKDERERLKKAVSFTISFLASVLLI
ncbi:protein serine/threonine phosphatase 2C family protein [archaeon]|nr:MAG: protein serine/threonine phosphatase 2C family protein [archaeon]